MPVEKNPSPVLSALPGTRLPLPGPVPAGRSMQSRTDLGRLIERVATGDRAAFEAFYRRTASNVHTLVHRVVADESASADITRDVYLRVWSRAHTYQQTGCSAESWLFALTHECAVDRVRRTPAGNHRSAVQKGTTTLLAAPVLSLLTPLQAEALELAYFSGLMHQECAARLGVDRSTFRLRLRTALSRLHEGLESP